MSYIRVFISDELYARWDTFHRQAPSWKDLDELVAALLTLHFDESDAVLKSIQDQEREKK
jgi:hypothetical protein